MDSIPVLTIEDVASIENVMVEYLQKSRSVLAVLIDRGGNLMANVGNMEVMDVTTMAALAAGSFAATRELAKRIGEVEFTALFHEGSGNHIFMNSIDDDTI